MKNECSTCQFFLENQGAWRGVLGDCRRYAPKGRHDPTRENWPQVFLADWCGEYRTRVVQEDEGNVVS